MLAAVCAAIAVFGETVLENDVGTMTFDDRGWVVSMKEKATGRELVKTPVSFVTTRDGTPANWEKNSVRMEKRGENRYAFVFGELGEAVLSVTPFAGGWTFRNESCTVKNCPEMEFCRLNPVCRTYDGSVANALSDDESFVMVRPYAPTVKAGRLWIRARADAPEGLTGHSAGLAFGPRAKVHELWKAMTLVSGAPHTSAGGAWAWDSPDANGSYMFSTPPANTWDAHLQLVRRSGCTTQHIICWGDGDRFYEPHPGMFPGGRAEMKAVFDGLHAVGKKGSIHTYTSAIPRSLATNNVASLLARHHYTLAEPFGPDSTEIVVNELPEKDHWCEFSYWGGNCFRVGDELVQYTAVRREKPYGFTGLTRGAFGTRKCVKPVPAGGSADYLQNGYACFYADPHTPLADRLRDHLEKLFREIGIDQIYFDASEGAGAAAPLLRRKLFEGIAASGRPVILEASDYGPDEGWFYTRIGALDSPTWGRKRFHDRHLKECEKVRKANFLPPHMGWWGLDLPSDWRGRGELLDEAEYFVSKCAAYDSSMSLQPPYPPIVRNDRPFNYALTRLMTVCGWWEYPRLAKAIRPELLKELSELGTEWRLRQDDRGEWGAARQTIATHRVAQPGSGMWTADLPAAKASEFRVMALYGVEPWTATNAIALFTPGTDAAAIVKETAKGMEQEVSTASDPAHGTTLRIVARNGGVKDAKAAWTKAEFTADKMEGRSRNVGKEKKHRAYGVWVKGDGSGAVLNVQLKGFHSFTESYVHLDFTGWRYFAFNTREKDIDEFDALGWPYHGELQRTFMDPFEMTSYKGVTFWLTGIPEGRSATAEVSGVLSLPDRKDTLRDITLTVNGRDMRLPFDLVSGEYAEYADGAWEHFGEHGEPLGRVRAAGVPLAVGANGFAFAAKTASGLPARVETWATAVGEARPAFVPLDAAKRKALGYEALMPAVFAPELGYAEIPPVRVRPGEKAALEVEIWGACANPALTFPDRTVTFPAKIGREQHLVCRDGANWQVLDGKHAVVASGRLPQPLPVLKGGETKVGFACEGAKDVIRVDLVKIYR